MLRTREFACRSRRQQCINLGTDAAPGVCTENSVRIDLVTESLNVIDDGRVVRLLSDALRLAVQVEEPT
jgi:hypothetical protein